LLFLVPLAKANCSNCCISFNFTEANYFIFSISCDSSEANLHIRLCYEAIAGACLAPEVEPNLPKLLSREAFECLAPEAIHFSYLCQRVIISWAIHPLSLGPSPSIRFLSPEGCLKD
jgi:hypothetical protein